MPASIEQDAIQFLQSRGTPIFEGNVRNAIRFLEANPDQRPSYDPRMQEHWSMNASGTMPSTEDVILQEVSQQSPGLDIDNPPVPRQRPETPNNIRTNPPIPGQRPSVPDNIRTNPPVPGQRPAVPQQTNPASNPAFGADNISAEQPRGSTLQFSERMQHNSPNTDNSQQDAAPVVQEYTPGQTQQTTRTQSSVADPNDTWQQRAIQGIGTKASEMLNPMSSIDLLMDELRGSQVVDTSVADNMPNIQDDISSRVAPGAQGRTQVRETTQDDDGSSGIFAPIAPIIPPTNPQTAQTAQTSTEPLQITDQRTVDQSQSAALGETSPQAYRDAFDAARLADNPREAAMNFFSIVDENPSLRNQQVMQELTTMLQEEYGLSPSQAYDAAQSGVRTLDNPVETQSRRDRIFQLLRRGIR